MKRAKLVKHIADYGCIFEREGGNHTIFINPKTFKTSAIPRHAEIGDVFCNEICKQLGIPKIK
jgi:predicted RNA binding protein YcfA (HicA-like mRNA interferase family)